MIVQRRKFPYKWMLSIISTFEKENSLSPSQVARSIGSCISDAKEVLRMLQYLTSFGKIIMDSEDKWKIGDFPEDTDSTNQNFRLKYIQALTELIQNLNKEAQSSESLAEKTSNKVIDVQEALVFSKFITEKGYFQSQGSGYSQQWSLRRWS